MVMELKKSRNVGMPVKLGDPSRLRVNPIPPCFRKPIILEESNVKASGIML